MSVQIKNRQHQEQSDNTHVIKERRRRISTTATNIAWTIYLLVLLSSVYISTVESWSVNRLTNIRPISPSFSSSSPRAGGGKRAKVRSILRRIIPFQSTSNDDVNGSESTVLKAENKLLREVIGELEEENARLKQRAGRIVLETFEGEKLFRDGGASETTTALSSDGEGLTLTGEELLQDELWCDELEGDQCPIEPQISFGAALRDRAYWLVGLLVMQSCSGIILSRNEALLADHPVIIFFLTMLVGAGGNAGNQASVRVIRGLALGTLNETTRGQFLLRELKMAAALSLILAAAGFFRAVLFKTGIPEAIAVTAALGMIVFSSVCLGAVLPIILEFLGVDPAHSSTTIQVIMDILGVILAVVVSRNILDGPFGEFLVSRLGG